MGAYSNKFARITPGRLRLLISSEQALLTFESIKFLKEYYIPYITVAEKWADIADTREYENILLLFCLVKTANIGNMKIQREITPPICDLDFNSWEFYICDVRRQVTRQYIVSNNRKTATRQNYKKKQSSAADIREAAGGHKRRIIKTEELLFPGRV